MFGIPVKFIIYAAVIAAALGALYVYGARERKAGGDAVIVEVQAETQETNQKIRKIKKVIKHETQSFERRDIVRDLCANGWVRNPDQCTN